PDTTKLVWDGAAGGVMFNIDGVAYSKFNRLTFNGASKAGIAVDQSWNGQVQHFDTGNEYADDRFVDVGTGIRAGNLGHGGAETSVLRSKFIRNTVAGINTKNFNTLDWFIWHSTFEDCAVGVTNDPGAGNFNVYYSV